MSDSQLSSRIAFFILFGVTVALFTVHLLRHFRNFHAPFLQRYIIRLLFLPVIFAFCAFVNFVNTGAADFTEIVTSFYGSCCLAVFFNMIIAAGGGMEMSAMIISGQLSANILDANGTTRTSSNADSNGSLHTTLVIAKTDLPRNQEEKQIAAQRSGDSARPVGVPGDLSGGNSRMVDAPLPPLTVSESRLGMPILLHLQMKHNGALANGSSMEMSDATVAALRRLNLWRFLVYQVVVVKTLMSVVTAIVAHSDGENSTLLMIPRVLGIVSLITTLRTLYALYKAMEPSRLLRKLSLVQKLFWMKTQIGVQVAGQFILQTIANAGATLPTVGHNDESDQTERSIAINAVLTVAAANLFIVLAFWVLPANDPAIVEWEHAMHLRPSHNKCGFCLRSIVLCDIYIESVQLQEPPAAFESPSHSRSAAVMGKEAGKMAPQPQVLPLP